MSMNGRKPENLQVGRLEIAKKKAQRTGKKNRKKSELGRKNAGPRVKC